MTKERLFKTAVWFMACGLLCSCGEFAYKRGASNKDFAQAKQSCAAANEAEVARCMQENGWYVEKIDDLQLFATVSTQSNQAQSNPTPVAVTARSPESDYSKDHAQVAVAKDKAAPSSLPEPSIFIYKINSWWKLGGNAQQLENALKTCSSDVGTKDLSNKAKQMYTKDYVLCMHQYGWKGLNEY